VERDDEAERVRGGELERDVLSRAEPLRDQRVRRLLNRIVQPAVGPGRLAALER
jgi:hypothetical protein